MIFPSLSTLVELLQQRALCAGQQRAFTFLLDGETEEAHLTYGELDRRVRAVAARLQCVVPAGECVVLLCPPGLDYIAAIFGCLYAAVVAVPAFPGLRRTLPRLQAIVANSHARVVLTTEAILTYAEPQFAKVPELSALQWIALDAINPDLEVDWCEPFVTGETLAFLQYTSGSTGSPKGVMLTHENLLSNSKLISHGFEMTPEDVGVIWLPPYHDMGLVGGILQPLFVGFPVVLMSPLSFLSRPMRWLEAVSRYRATCSGGPNFAYDLCSRRSTPEERARLDLHHWDVAFCGAEPIRAATREQFAAMFEPCGFRRESFYPCYGLSEATLIVSGGKKAAPPVVIPFQKAALANGQAVAADTWSEHAVMLVGCGRALPGQEILIVDPVSKTPCQAGKVGEIWVSGASVARGYWNQPAATEDTFQAHLADGINPYLRTGDLGFVHHDNELFIVGRSKDVIIIWGRNYFPQDIELTVEECHDALRPGCGAAFSVEISGEERLVIVQELERSYLSARHLGSGTDHHLNRQATPDHDPQPLNPAELFERIRSTVAEQHQLAIHAIALIKAGTISKTSSGKIQRQACRTLFLTGGLNVRHEWRASADQPPMEYVAPRIPEEEKVAEIFAQVLNLPRVGIHDNFFELGGDSILAIAVATCLREVLQVDLPLHVLYETPTVARLAVGVAKVQAVR